MEKTTDYEIFKKHSSNRQLNKDNVRKIRASIQQKNMLQLRPIIVNKNMEIIDGQHRLEVAKELQLELFYIIHEDSVDSDMILFNNNQKKWTLHEFLNYFSEKGYHEYVEFKKFLNKNEWIDITTLLVLIGKNNGDQWEKFKAGHFEFVNAYEQNLVRIMFVEEIVMLIKNTLIRKDKRPFSGSRFISALTFLTTNEDFNLEMFTHKLKGQLDRIYACATKEGYVNMLKGIYNYKNKNPIN